MQTSIETNKSIETKDIETKTNKKYKNPQKYIKKIKEQEKKSKQKEGGANSILDRISNNEYLNAKNFGGLSQKEAFSKLKKILTKDKLQDIIKKKEKNPNYVDNDLLESGTSEYFIKFLTQKENKQLLNIVIENGLWNITGVCPPEKDIQKLKNIYKQEKINNIKNILNGYTFANGKDFNIEDIFSKNACDPLISIKKLKNLVDKDGNPISQETIRKILGNIGKVKTLENKDIIKDRFFKGNELGYNEFIKEISKLGVNFTKLPEDKQNNIIKQISIELNLNFTDKQIDSLRKVSLNIIKANNIENIIKSNITKELENLKKQKDISQAINNFSSQDLDPKFTSGDLQGFYETPFEEQKFAGKYILDGAINKNFITKNSWLYKKLNKILTRKDLNKESTAELAENIIKYIQNSWIKHLIPNSFIHFLKRVSNNARETQYFFNTGKLTNTENIWLFNNKPKDLNIYNGEKAPNTLGHNQITTRENFIKVFKTTNINNINSNGLIDYFYKTKIKYGNWDDAIGIIYSELGDKKFKEIKKFAENNQKLNGNFRKFLEQNKSIVDIMSKFHGFQDKKDIKNDIKIATKALVSDRKNPVKTIVVKEFEKIQKGEIPNPTAIANLTGEIVKNPTKHKILKASVSKALVNGITTSQEQGKKIAEKIGGKKGQIYGTIIDITQKYEIKLADKQAKEIVNKYINGGLDIKILINNINTLIPQAKNLSAKKYKQFILDTVSSIDNGLKEKLEEEYKLLKEYSNNSNNLEKKKQIAKKIKNLLETNPLLREITLRILKKENNPKNTGFIKYLENFNSNNDLNSASNFSSNTSFNSSEKTLKDCIHSINKTDQVNKKVIKKTDSDELKKNGSKAIDNTLKHNKELAQEYYSTMYTSVFIDENEKQQIKQQAEKEGINLDNKEHNSKSKFADNQINDNHTNISEQIFNSNKTQNISFTYKEQGGLIKMKNPFAKDGLDDSIIEGKDTKDVNEKFLLSYLKNIGFYQADDFNLSKDSEKIYQQFNIDITKALTAKDIRNFTKIFSGGIIYNLKNNHKISSIHKKYIQNFENKITTDPNNSENYKDLFTFLNDNINCFIQTGLYDFTERKVKLEDFINKEKNQNQKFKEYLIKNKLIS